MTVKCVQTILYIRNNTYYLKDGKGRFLSVKGWLTPTRALDLSPCIFTYCLLPTAQSGPTPPDSVAFVVGISRRALSVAKHRTEPPWKTALLRGSEERLELYRKQEPRKS